MKSGVFCRADHATSLLSTKVGTKFRRQVAVGIVRLRTKGHGVFFFFGGGVEAVADNFMERTI
jgi:hypothetical protein